MLLPLETLHLDAITCTVCTALHADFGGLTAQVGWLGLRVGDHPMLSLHSSNELGELSQ